MFGTRNSLSISSEIGNLQWQSNALTNLGAIYTEIGDYDEAAKTLNKGLNIAQATGDRYVEAWTYYRLGLLQKQLLNYSKAEQFLLYSKKLFEELGNNSEKEQVAQELEVLTRNH